MPRQLYKSNKKLKVAHKRVIKLERFLYNDANKIEDLYSEMEDQAMEMERLREALNKERADNDKQNQIIIKLNMEIDKLRDKLIEVMFSTSIKK